MNKARQLTDLIALLGRHAQRAIYAASGGVVGLPAQSVMFGRAKLPENSWVVAKKNGLPTGYAEVEMRPLLRSDPHVLSTREALEAWLQGRGYSMMLMYTSAYRGQS